MVSLSCEVWKENWKYYILLYIFAVYIGSETKYDRWKNMESINSNETDMWNDDKKNYLIQTLTKWKSIMKRNQR